MAMCQTPIINQYEQSALGMPTEVESATQSTVRGEAELDMLVHAGRNFRSGNGVNRLLPTMSQESREEGYGSSIFRSAAHEQSLSTQTLGSLFEWVPSTVMLENLFEPARSTPNVRYSINDAPQPTRAQSARRNSGEMMEHRSDDGLLRTVRTAHLPGLCESPAQTRPGQLRSRLDGLSRHDMAESASLRQCHNGAHDIVGGSQEYNGIHNNSIPAEATGLNPTADESLSFKHVLYKQTRVAPMEDRSMATPQGHHSSSLSYGQQRYPTSISGLRDPQKVAQWSTVPAAFVTGPYPYNRRSRDLAAFLRSRLSSNQRSRAAKALTSIERSSSRLFGNLGFDDLTFAEECFQRALRVHQDFIKRCNTPNVICRRTGEIAAVNNAFLRLTRQPHAVLVGNTRVSVVDVERNNMVDKTHAGSVFLVELMDAKSIVQFYEDMAHAAVSDSSCVSGRPVTVTRPGLGPRVIRNDHIMGANRSRHKVPTDKNKPRMIEWRQPEETVRCMMSWTVKKDIFGMPFLLVLNVSSE